MIMILETIYYITQLTLPKGGWVGMNFFFFKFTKDGRILIICI
jgi:hypothetical protein